MNDKLATKMARELVGSEIGGWEVRDLLGNGKSALVLRAVKNGQTAAIKVFDPELIEKYGETTQLDRIEREKRLIEKQHSHLVRIFDGGKCIVTGHLFVAMEHIPAKDLSKLLKVVPPDRVRPLIAQLALAARFLQEQELAHRDIKPSNIVVSDDFQHLTLLDLGVLRPFGETGLTDTESQQFVATLQYSSPELLFRKEEDTPDGWCALAFYQIGAVLHDLITRKPIFEDFCNPYSRLVEAVKNNTPDLTVPGADLDLVCLAQCCLVKDPAKRLRLVTWDSFAAASPHVCTATIKDRVRKRQASASMVQHNEPVTISRRLELNSLLGRTSTMIRDECLRNVDMFPPVEVHDHPLPDADTIAFRAGFPESTEKALPVAFALLICIQLLDAAADIVEIRVSAAASSDVRKFPSDAYSPSFVLYRGQFEEEVVKRRINLLLYLAIEAAIAHPAISFEETLPLSITIPQAME